MAGRVLMAVAVALALGHLQVSESATRWIAYCMIGTVWGNAAFYIGANLSANRALSVGDNQFGSGNLWGLIGFTTGLVAANLVLIALVLATMAAFRTAREG